MAEMAPALPRPLITRGAPIAGLSPRIAALFAELEARWADLQRIPVGDPAEDAAQERIFVVGDRIAAFEPRTIAEAAALLQAVFLDAEADQRPGLPQVDQVAVLGHVRDFLAAHTAAVELSL